MKGKRFKPEQISKILKEFEGGKSVQEITRELAKRLNISTSRLARIIEYMKDQGAPIKFNRAKNTYYYESRYSIKIDVKIEKINEKELKDINAGINFSLNNYMNAFFVH